MNEILVSIGIITFNQESLIADCLNSCLNQTYKNIEIVVSDDYSTDKTREIILDFASKYPDKIRFVFNEVNLGITKNSNVALKACRGEFIVIMGGDDELLPKKVSKQVALLKANPEMAFCGHEVEIFSTLQNKSLGLFSKIGLKIQGSDHAKVIKYGQPYCALSIMFRKAYLPNHGYDERLLIVSDWKLCIDLLLGQPGSTYGYINEVLGVYKRHSNNITNKLAENRLIDMAITIDIVEFTYPRFRKSAQYARLRMFYSAGRMFQEKNDKLKAINYFFNVTKTFQLGNTYFYRAIYRLLTIFL